LLLAALGVIESDRPVSAKVVDATVVEVLYVAFTTCNTLPPPAGAAHFRPVGETELSATMLQLGKGIILASAQSCAIVVDNIG
jgi:hypothetical protein